jgi:hypothetical protein
MKIIDAALPTTDADQSAGGITVFCDPILVDWRSRGQKNEFD